MPMCNTFHQPMHVVNLSSTCTMHNHNKNTHKLCKCFVTCDFARSNKLAYYMMQIKIVHNVVVDLKMQITKTKP